MSGAQLVSVEVMSQEVDAATGFDYRAIASHQDREWAESAAGFITFDLGQAVVKVLRVGNLLTEAKQRLPHGEYLPWVEKACGLKPSHARKLIQAVAWANGEHVPVLESVTDTATLFMLSADTTTEEVKQWFMERAAAGNPPSRAEVAERKRQASGKPPAPRPIELQALALWRKDQLSDAEAALALARSITTVIEAQVREEVGLRELPRGKVLQGLAADFHRRPDGSGWDRIPHAGRVDATLAAIVPAALAVADEPKRPRGFDILSTANTADLLGMKPMSLSCQMSPKRNPNGLVRRGYRVTRAGRGFFKVEQHP